jgi:hypothetical protein
VVGIASAPIGNVTYRDTVDGGLVVLGKQGNAKISEADIWPAGIQLNPATGAIGATNSVAVGTYVVKYQLCEDAPPADCATTTATISVIAPVVAEADAGSAIVGTASTATASVIANDLVNGAPPLLGPSGNAIIAITGTWPAGLTLDTSTGAVNASSSLAAGSYHVHYSLCDHNSPADCSTATDNVTVMPPYAEVQASTAAVYGDIEFDWARDGIYCAACNFGLGNSQVNWTDHANNLWVNKIDPDSGLFMPGTGQGTLVDTTAFFWEDWGNGPEWAFSTPVAGQQPISQLVYSRYVPGHPATGASAGAALATLVDGTQGPTWQVKFFPGAISLLNNTVLPEASQCNGDPLPLAVFKNLATPTQMFTEPVTIGVGTTPSLTPFGAYASGLAERWVPCTHWMTFQGIVTIGPHPGVEQVFWYDTDTQVVQQLTFDATTKERAVMFKAPEFTDSSGSAQYVLMALAEDSDGNTTLQIYLQNGSTTNGAPAFQLINTIRSPDPSQPYIFDPKAFINCSPDCHTFIAMGLSSVLSSQQTETEPNGLGVSNINPQTPFFEVLAPSVETPSVQRFDPKYFITGRGPVLYYDRALTLTRNQPLQSQGIFFINMQLGIPSGNCVGSSAEGGLATAWPNC